MFGGHFRGKRDLKELAPNDHYYDSDVDATHPTRVIVSIGINSVAVN